MQQSLEPRQSLLPSLMVTTGGRKRNSPRSSTHSRSILPLPLSVMGFTRYMVVRLPPKCSCPIRLACLTYRRKKLPESRTSDAHFSERAGSPSSERCSTALDPYHQN